MKQILVVSDTHGRNSVHAELRNLYPNADAYLHCGDSESPASELDGFVSVKGNNDLYYDYPAQIILDLDGVRILLIHGHQYPMYHMVERLILKAKEEECQLVLYGHSHAFKVTREDGITLVNPGSIHHNRDASLPSYAVITLNKGEITVERKEYPWPEKKRKWF